MNNKEKKTHSMKARGMISDVVVHVVLALLAIVWVIPVLWIALLSFSTQKGSYVTSFFQKGYTLHNYVRLFTDTQVLDFPQMFKNTFIIAVFSCLISTIFVLSVSYCMSRMRFKIRKTYMNIAMILGLFPAFMSMVAVYYIFKGSWPFGGINDPRGIDSGVLGRFRSGIPACKGIFRYGSEGTG